MKKKNNIKVVRKRKTQRKGCIQISHNEYNKMADEIIAKGGEPQEILIELLDFASRYTIK